MTDNTLEQLKERIENLLYCDACCKSEVDDIISTRGDAPILQMIEEDGLTLCQRCYAADRLES